MANSIIPTETLWEHYKTSKSVWNTGKHFGLAGQSVHERLKKHGYKLYGEKFSAEEDSIIRQVYSMSPGVRDLNLKKLAKVLNRPHHTNISRRARELGLTDPVRQLTMAQRDKHSTYMLSRVQSATPTRTYSNIEKGWFTAQSGAKYYLKSGWEMKYAQYLDFLLKNNAISSWEYEPDTFWFEKIKRGVRSYTPDFRITYKDGSVEYHEVKGWMDERSQTKIKRMGIYHKRVKLVVVDKHTLKGMGLI